MARSRNGQAISRRRRSGKEISRLKALLAEARVGGDLGTWRRAKAVAGYIEGKKVIEMSGELEVTRGSINKWLQWYEAAGADGLRPRKAAGPSARLDASQRDELASMVEAGPQAAGFSSGVWTGPMVGDLIWQEFGVRYHNHYVPVLLHTMGFSVQRPRKRLARADAEAQGRWLRERLPRIKKRPPLVEES